MDEEKNDISRQILLQIFYQHLIRQPAAATFRPCLGDAYRVRLRESVNSPCLGDADRVRLLESVNFPCLGDADRVRLLESVNFPVSATPTAFASQIGQFPAGEELIGKTNNMYLAKYYLGDECILVFSQSLLPGGQMQIDSESAIIREVKIGEFTGNMLTYDKDDMIIIFWNDGRYGYDLTGYGLDAETLIMVAQSVR